MENLIINTMQRLGLEPSGEVVYVNDRVSSCEIRCSVCRLWFFVRTYKHSIPDVSISTSNNPLSSKIWYCCCHDWEILCQRYDTWRGENLELAVMRETFK